MSQHDCRSHFFSTRVLGPFRLFGVPRRFVNIDLRVSTHHWHISASFLLISFCLVKHVACYVYSFRISVSSLGRKVGLCFGGYTGAYCRGAASVYIAMGGVQNREYKFRVSSLLERDR